MDLNVGLSSSQTQRKESDVTITNISQSFSHIMTKKAAGIYTVGMKRRLLIFVCNFVKNQRMFFTVRSEK